MAYEFKNRISKHDIHNALLQTLGVKMTEEDLERLARYKRNWDFYDGYHWEDIPPNDKPQVTENYIRAFVDKFVSFELGGGFKIKQEPHIENMEGDNNPYQFLESVWEYNNRLEKCVELGQSKAITGDGWIQVSYSPKYDSKGKRNKEFFDPFDEFESGKIKITVLPSAIVFPVYSDAHDREHVEKLDIMYPVYDNQEQAFGFTHRGKLRQTLYKQSWTAEKVEIFYKDMHKPIQVIPNKYGVIPFVQIKNFPQQGKNEGMSDVEDIIPLNVELNMKKSDISEIIDYHSAPITMVFGARVSQLERGANKVWGGLPNDAKVENLRLEGDLTSATNYLQGLKVAMHEVGNIPEGVLGGSLAISNTSGVALQIALLPLLERVKIKQVLTKEGLETINKLILLIGEKEGMIQVPKDIKRSEFFKNEVTFTSILPKDGILELQELEQEMKLGLTSREEAMKRRGKDHIQDNIAKIDADMEAHPSLYGKQDIQKEIDLAEGQALVQQQMIDPVLAEGGAEAELELGNSPSSTKEELRPVGVNKEGNPKQLNAGFTNSPEPKK